MVILTTDVWAAIYSYGTFYMCCLRYSQKKRRYWGCYHLCDPRFRGEISLTRGSGGSCSYKQTQCDGSDVVTLMHSAEQLPRIGGASAPHSHSGIQAVMLVPFSTHISQRPSGPQLWSQLERSAGGTSCVRLTWLCLTYSRLFTSGRTWSPGHA